MAGTPVLGSEGVPLLVTGDAPWLAARVPVLGPEGVPLLAVGTHPRWNCTGPCWECHPWAS